jgi:hypothetical protein
MRVGEMQTGAREAQRREDREKLNHHGFIRDRAPVNPMR